MRWYKKTKVVVEKLKDITCDKCGCVSSNTKDPETNAGVTITMSAGYGSAHDNLCSVRWDLCDDCWEGIQKTFINKGNTSSCFG